MSAILDGLVNTVNRLQMVSVGALMNQFLMGWTVISLTWLAEWLLINGDTLQQGYGFQIAGIAAGIVLGKVGVNHFGAKDVRKTSREFMDRQPAIERAKAEGAAMVAAATSERPALPPIQPLARAPGAPLRPDLPVGQPGDTPDPPEWVDGDPEEGVI